MLHQGKQESQLLTVCSKVTCHGLMGCECRGRITEKAPKSLTVSRKHLLPALAQLKGSDPSSHSLWSRESPISGKRRGSLQGARQKVCMRCRVLLAFTFLFSDDEHCSGLVGVQQKALQGTYKATLICANSYSVNTPPCPE